MNDLVEFSDILNQKNISNFEEVEVLNLPNVKSNYEGLEKFQNLKSLRIYNLNANNCHILKNLNQLECLELCLSKDVSFYPPNLKELTLDENRIDDLNNLPDNIEFLTIYGGVNKISKLPKKLKSLICLNNEQLICLPELPEDLEILNCAQNNISDLPELPDSLMEIYCNDNKLSKLPTLPKSLNILDISNNYWIGDSENIEELPIFPAYLQTFIAKNLEFMDQESENILKSKYPNLKTIEY